MASQEEVEITFSAFATATAPLTLVSVLSAFWNALSTDSPSWQTTITMSFIFCADITLSRSVHSFNTEQGNTRAYIRPDPLGRIHQNIKHTSPYSRNILPEEVM